MSVHISSDVWRHSKAKGAALLVLLSLADQANDDGQCWPKVEKIAARCRISRASVLRHLADLRDLGELSWENRSARAQPNFYTVNVGGTRSQIETGEANPVADCDGPRLTGETGPVSTVRLQEPSIETSPEPSQADAATSVAALFDDFWKAYPRHIGKAAAARKFATLCKTVDPQAIIAGAARFAQLVAKSKTEQGFIPHPTTWLNAGRWEDELPEVEQPQVERKPGGLPPELLGDVDAQERYWRELHEAKAAAKRAGER